MLSEYLPDSLLTCLPAEMKVLTLLQPHGAQDQQAASGGLYSNYIGQNMENRCLIHASVLPQSFSGPVSQPSSCPSLQPSRLTSTTSSLLSTTTSSLTSPCLTSPLLTSPLLSTENKFLKKDSLLFPHSLSLPSPLPHLFSSTLAPSTRVLPPTCSLPPPVLNVDERMGGEGRIRQPASEDALSYYEEMTVVYGTMHPFQSGFVHVVCTRSLPVQAHFVVIVPNVFSFLLMKW